MNENNIFKSMPPATNVSQQYIQVHPCVINGQAHVVYPKGLQEKSPELFEQLKHYYTGKGYSLKEDQRGTSNIRPRHKDRRRWAPLVLFTASMLFDGGANAEIRNDNHGIETFHSQQTTLHLLNPQQTHLQIERHIRSLNDPGTNAKTSLKSGAADKIFTILQAHYKKTNSDPTYLTEDFKKIANYYSEFPQVIALIEPLKDKDWVLSYDKDNWDTVASGNEFQVEKAVIHFNTRSAAQLLLNRKCSDNPVCIASPADALLHELLHTYSMLVDSTQFVMQGGMNNVLYPYQHEYAIIDAERKLYASMSRVDEVKRPQRTDHTGRAVIAHCPVCIK